MTGSSFSKLLGGKRGKEPAVPPVIVIGSHRSGTSLVIRCLEKAGLFAGADLDPNHESLFFIGLNDWMLAQAGCRWDRPEPFHGFLDQPELGAKAIEQVEHMMTMPAAKAYLGARSRDELTAMSRPWGWKDPRNTLTLPAWLKIFPGARIVHVIRHGVDVAASLTARSRYVMSRWHNKKKLTASDVITDSARCLTLEGAFSLWAHYIRAARSHTICDEGHITHVHYEDILARPEEQFRALAAFCGLSLSGSRIASLTHGIKSDRAYAYRRDPHLAVFARENRDELAVNGYEP